MPVVIDILTGETQSGTSAPDPGTSTSKDTSEWDDDDDDDAIVGSISDGTPVTQTGGGSKATGGGGGVVTLHVDAKVGVFLLRIGDREGSLALLQMNELACVCDVTPDQTTTCVSIYGTQPFFLF